MNRALAITGLGFEPGGSKPRLIPANFEALHMGRDYVAAHLKPLGLQVTHTDKVGDNIFVWKMNGFGPLDAVQEATKRARKHKAFVIDLRGNGGGAVDALTELVSRTFDHDLEIFTLRQRARDRVERARPKDAFEGKLIVLVDSQTASAAEIEIPSGSEIPNACRTVERWL